LNNSAVRRIDVKQLSYDLTPVGGLALALVGHSLKALQPQCAAIDAALPVRGGVRNSDILRSYLVGPAKFTLRTWACSSRARATLTPSKPSGATPSSTQIFH
jgi:hypothetical protein